MNLQLLRNLQIDRIDTDDAVALAGYARMVRQSYSDHNLQAPEFVTQAVEILDREIATRRKDYLAKRLRDLAQQKEGLKTAAEKRADVDREMAAIKAELGA